MILYLLFPLLIIGIGESQTVSRAEEELSMESNSTMKPSHVTSSMYKDESQIEDELKNNQTSTFTREDYENFQDQEREYPHRHCMRDMLVQLSQEFCEANFYMEMQTIGTENWCRLDIITRPYNDLTLCLEKLSDLVKCYYPNQNTHDIFLYIHSYYFKNCSKEEPLFEDAPHGLVLVLTLIPVSLIPVLVYLVVWKSKVQE